jgi:hypothetical protein
MQWDPMLPGEFVERLWNDPDELLKQQVLQDKLRCTVARVDESFGTFTWKRHSWGGAWRAVRRCLSRSTARKSWLDGRFLHERGVSTPQPRLFLERRLGPFKGRSYLLTDFVPGTSLYRYMRFRHPSADEIDDFAQQTAAIWQRLADLQIQHNDFQTENLLVDPRGKLWLIDLERLCRNQAGERARRKQISDLDRLLHPRNWRAKPESAAVFRREILKTAAGAKILADAPTDDHPLKRPIDTVNRDSQLVTVLICTRNAEATIGKCLRSVHDMADEILVADAGSTDNTLQLVRQFGGCRIIERRGLSDTEFARWASLQARHPWILRIEPDEQLSAELAREIQYVLASEPADDAFQVLQTVCFRGQWLQHGGLASKPSIRLYRKMSGQPKRIGRIPYSVTRELCPSIQHVVTMQILQAVENASVGSAECSDSRPSRPILAALRQLLRSLILKSAWLDGWAGVHASCLSALSIYLNETVRRELQQAAHQATTNSSKVCQDLEDFKQGVAATLPFAPLERTGHPVENERRARRAA